MVCLIDLVLHGKQDKNRKTLVRSGIGSRGSLTKVQERNASSYDPLTPTIFHEDWWLDAATGGNFDVAEVTVSGRKVGRLPFHVRSRLGLRIMNMPSLTYFLGPAIDDGEGSPNNRFFETLGYNSATNRTIATWPIAIL